MSRLEWTQCRNGVWKAQAGHIELGAWEMANGCEWSVGDSGRMLRDIGGTDTLDEAKDAAEAAALDLLCACIAALSPSDIDLADALIAADAHKESP